MSWLDNDGKISENILFSKFTYVRNLTDTPAQGMSAEQLESFLSDAEELLKKNGFSMQSVEQNGSTLSGYLCEHQYIESDSCGTHGVRAVFFNEPCNLCISVGGTNLICISSILSGASIRDAYKISSSAEELMDSKFDFAFSHSKGYLSPVPTDCGSGTRMTCAVYLPLLAMSGKISSLTARLCKHGVSLYPLFSHKSTGDIYMMTCSPSRSIPEEEAVGIFEQLVSYALELERAELDGISGSTLFSVAEEASRAEGILSFCLSLSENELIDLTSRIRLSVYLGSSDMLVSSITPRLLNQILFDNLSCSVMTHSNSPITDRDMLDRERAMSVRRLVTALPAQGALVNT